MAQYEIKLNSAKNVANEMESMYSQINSILGRLHNVHTDLNASDGSLLVMKRKILLQEEFCRLKVKKLNLLISILLEIIRLYEYYEDIIRNSNKGLDGKSPVYDNNGQYGGDQGSAMNASKKKKEEYYKIIRKYYPNYSDFDCENFLEKLDSEGCGYVAVINTLCVAYVGREEEFEQIFGYPLYKDGDFNYDEILIDFYASKDNWSASGYNSEEDDSSVKGIGTNSYNREYRFETYLQEHGVEADYRVNVDVNPSNFNEVSDNGDVIISYFDGYITDENGNQHYIDGGHAMTVTGVTEDGRYIVSSWGEKYYIDPKSDVTNETTYYFDQVEYK